MTEPTTADIRKRHTEAESHHLKMYAAIPNPINLGTPAHKDRGILLDRLEAAEQTIERAMRYAFEAGYGAGHNDTVEGMFSLDEETMSEEWLADIKSEGTFQAILNPPPPRS